MHKLMKHYQSTVHGVFFPFNNCGNNPTKASFKPINCMNETLLDQLAQRSMKIEIILYE